MQAVIVDIDGVLCDSGEEIREFLEQHPELAHAPWPTDHCVGLRAEPRPEYVSLVRSLHHDIRVVLLTNRPAAHREATIEWLQRHGVRWDHLVMWDPDEVPDYHEHKRVHAERIVRSYERILFAIDDSHTHCESYRALGLPTIEVLGGFRDHGSVG